MQPRRAFLKTARGAAFAALIGDLRPHAIQATNAPDRRITAVTLIHGLPGRDADLKQHLLSLAGPTRAEPGCVTYDLYQSPERRHEFMRLEVWTSRDALELHKTLPHLKASFEKRQREGWKTEIMVFERVREDQPSRFGASARSRRSCPSRCSGQAEADRGPE